MGVCGASSFILTIVDDVYFGKLCDPTTFYTDVLPSSLLEIPEKRCTGLNVRNAINLLLIIQR